MIVLLASTLVTAVSSSTCDVASLTDLLPTGSNATISYAVSVPANGTFGGGSADLEFPRNDTGLPALCAVAVNVPSSENTSYNFGLFLPDVSNWNQRFIASGNGGFGGGINWNDMGTNVHYGFASLSTDTGHISGSGDGTWALNNPESRTDWGYRALHGSVVLGKSLVSAYYTQSISYSYYSGCSTGGRQGLKEVEMFPEDFDGVIAGAPAWWTTHLQTWTNKIGLWNLPVDSPTHIPTSLFPAIGAEVLRQCDPQDGLTDGIISDPYGCDFVPEVLLCGTPTAPNASTCLSAPQISTLYKIYNDYIETNDTFVFPHLLLGSESQWSVIVGTDLTGTPSTLGYEFVQDFLYDDPNWSFYNFSYQTVLDADAANPGMANADNFNLASFQSRGGKLLMYHGMADGLIATGSSVYFYKEVLKTLYSTTALNGSSALPISDFYRFYLIPGMQHCAGSPAGVDAPWYIAGANQPFSLGSSVYSVPGFEDPKHDALLALMQWTEKGIAPDDIIATKYVNDSINAGVQKQRPLCPWPKQARFTGNGSVDSAESWVCEGGPLF
ncbi:MAG: hypothetical protein M1820_001280 [Bogoriella megaspora]|nr:MAG: hypothetical protein M1820_001280 [Bogoriella megaspora]